MSEGGFSLRDVLDAKFRRVEDKIDDLASDVAALMAQEQRVAELEFNMRLVKMVGGAVSGVVLALAVPVIRSWIGL